MKNTPQRITFMILTAALLALFSASCGTVRGFGRDVETVGDNIENSAR